MPKYSYKCLNKDCEEIFEKVHSMKYRVDQCHQCSGSVERIPTNVPHIVNNKTQDIQKKGTLVKKSIESFREDLKDERERLKKIEYK